MTRPKIYLFGDSITQESLGDGGWGASLANHFSRSADVVLRGYSGYNTRWALKVFDRVFPAAAEPPFAVVVFFGANDASLPDRLSAHQHVPLHEYKNNLCSIISSLKKRWPNTVVLLVTPPPIDEAARLRDTYLINQTGKAERTNEAAGEYAKACKTVAAECQILVTDIWTKMQEFPNWKETYLRDGLHLSRQGNKIVFEAVREKLREAGICPENIEADLPLFADIDPKDPLTAFD